MLPRWHVLLGAIFTTFIWIVAPEITLLNIALIFFSSFLIDFDHYVTAALKTKKYNFKDIFKHHKKLLIKENRDIARGIRRKGEDFHLFHTMEFHILIAALSIFSPIFLYVFIGMIFHSLLDVIHLINGGKFHRREYFFFNWLIKKF